MVTPSREAAQKPSSATSKRGLGRKAWAALLRVRTGPECPEGNLRELTWDSKPDCGIATPKPKTPSPNYWDLQGILWLYFQNDQTVLPTW